MPGTRCAVSICNNSLQKTKAHNLGISYHKFPSDIGVQKQWIDACGRTDAWNPRTSVICSSHFTDDDFEMDMRTSLMFIMTRRKLKPLAVPSRNCVSQEGSSSTQYIGKYDKPVKTVSSDTEVVEHKIDNSKIPENNYKRFKRE